MTKFEKETLFSLLVMMEKELKKGNAQFNGKALPDDYREKLIRCCAKLQSSIDLVNTLIRA